VDVEGHDPPEDRDVAFIDEVCQEERFVKLQDSFRKKALGNSFPVPVVRLIGERIAGVEATLH